MSSLDLHAYPPRARGIGEDSRSLAVCFYLAIPGSMESEARPNFQLDYAATWVTPTEVFSFALRLTRITHAVKRVPQALLA